MAGEAAAAVIEGATQAAAVAESVVASAEASVENAEARVVAAEEVRDLVTEAALRDRISQRVEEFQEELDTCQNRADLLETQIQGAVVRLDEMALQIAEALNRLPPIVALVPPTPPNPSELISDNPAPPIPEAIVIAPTRANDADAAVRPVQRPAGPRYRVT